MTPKTAKEKKARTMAHQRNIRSRERKPPREYNDHSSCPVQRQEASSTQSGSPLDNSAHHDASTRESAAAAQRTHGLRCWKISENGENSRSSPEYSFPNVRGMRLQSIQQNWLGGRHDPSHAAATATTTTRRLLSFSLEPPQPTRLREARRGS